MITLNPTANLFPAVQAPEGTDLRTADSVKSGQQSLVDRLYYLDGIIRGATANASANAVAGGQWLVCPLVKMDPGETSWAVQHTAHGPTAVGLGAGFGHFHLPALVPGTRLRRLRIRREAVGGFVPTTPITFSLRRGGEANGDVAIAQVSAPANTLGTYQANSQLDLVPATPVLLEFGTYYLRVSGGQGQPNGESFWYMAVEILPGHAV